jgi:hypothetical protein
MNLEPLESAVLQKLLDGEHPILAALRHQLGGLCVLTREFSGVGFFTQLKPAVEAVPAPFASRTIRFGDVLARIPGLEHGAGFLLFVENGRLDMLEGYSFDEPWPARIRDFTLSYEDPARAAVLASLSEV